MKLFNKTIDRQLFKQYSLGSDLSKQEVVVKIFNPTGAGNWFILNSDPQDPDYLWAIVDLGYGAEVGSVSRNDLETYRGRFGLGFERDLGFDPINAEELYQGLRNGEYYADGGEMKGKDTWQNIFEEFDFKKGRSMYGLDMYYKKGYIGSVDHELRNVELMFEDDVIYKGFSVQGLLSALENQFGKRNFADGGEIEVVYERRADFKKKPIKLLLLSKGREQKGYTFSGKEQVAVLENYNRNKQEDLERLWNLKGYESKYADGGEVTVEDYEKRLQYLKMMKNNERTDLGKYNIEKEIRQINTILDHRKNFKNSYAVGGEVKDIKGKILGTILKESKTKGFDNKSDNNKILRLLKKNDDSESYGVQIGKMIYSFDNINEAEEEFKLLQQGYKRNFADGGEIEVFYERRADFKKKPIKLLLLSRGKEQRGYTFSGKDQVAVLDNYNRNKQEDLERLWNLKGYESKYADGGLTPITKYSLPNEEVFYNFKKIGLDGKVEKESVGFIFFNKHLGGIPIFVNNQNDDFDYKELDKTGFTHYKKEFADGGNIADFTDNQQMIMNQNVELEHHHEELEDILKDETPVPAWVVAKMATATQSISDVTHYLDGEKELMKYEMEDENEEEEEENEKDADEMTEIENKEVVEPIVVTAGDKTEITKNFTDDAFGNLKGFLKGMEGIDLRDDYTFDYKDEQYEVEPIINSDEKGVSNAVFTIFDGDGDEQGEIAYSSDGGKQKFTANSELFSWNNAKFEDGGFMNNVYADGGQVYDGVVDYKKASKLLMQYKPEILYYSDGYVFVDGIGLALGSLTNQFKGYGDSTDIKNLIWKVTHAPFDKAKANIEKFTKGEYTLTKGGYGNQQHFLKSTKKMADGGYFDGAIPKTSSYMSTYADGGFLDKYEVDRFKQVMNGKAIAKYIVRLQDSYGNKETYVFGIKLKDQFKGCELVPYEVLYGSWSDSGTPFALSNLQVKRLVPNSFSNIELDEQETEMLVNKLVNKNQAGVEKFLNSQFFYLNYNQTFKDVLRGHLALSIARVSSIEFEIVQKFADGGQVRSFDGIFGKEIIFKEEQVGKFTIGISSGFNNRRHVFIYEGEVGRYGGKGLPKDFNMSPQLSAEFADNFYSNLKRKVENNQDLTPFELIKEVKFLFADGGFMNDVYAKGGSVKKDWWQTVVNPNEDFNNYDDKKPIDWEVDDFKEWVVSNSDLDGNVDKEVLDVIKMPKSKLTVEYLNKNGSGKNNNEYYKEFGNWQSALYDVFTQIKKDYLFKKERKYILKSDIKTVTVKRKGKEVTYNASDVLNGAYVLAKGGDMTSKANYVGKNDVVEVELKDGSKVKPANGYWIKKGAEPVGAEPTPTNTGKSETKVGQTYIRKDMRGNWKAETNVDNFNDYDWRVSTIKTYSGKLISSAQGGKTEATGSKGIVMFKYAMYEDPNYTLEVSQPSRLTEKVVTEQHEKALAKFKKFMETGMFKGGGKISNFDKLSAKVAKNYEGKPVKSQFQEEYGKYYSKEEAQEVGDKVAGKVKAMQSAKKEMGGGTKKATSGSEMLKQANILAKEIRKDGESWNDAKKRAFAQLKK